MSNDEQPSEADEPDRDRRRLLGYLALLGLGATGAAGAWYSSRPDETEEPAGDDTTTTPTETSTEIEAPAEIPPFVERFAPDLYFGQLEKWYPTDPTEFMPENSEILDGPHVLEEYTDAFIESGAPPEPTVFYHVVDVAEDIQAIQYWMYSVFDQFTVNFHWHDWELLQVFVDTETDNPVLLSASAHSRKVPNNEFFDPVLPDTRRPGILSEVGSHSSASELNEQIPSFERNSLGTLDPDVTNDFVAITPKVSARLAYGLPRDEGARLPFVMPTLDGERLDEHPEVSVGRDAFIDESVTVDSWFGLPSPPDSIPFREPGLVMGHPDSPAAIDTTYELEHISTASNAIRTFDGPQLSFEFLIPGFVEDQFADHITSVGIPWEQPRFTDPLDDITDPAHRQRVDGASPAGLQDLVLGKVRALQSGAEGTLDRVSTDARDALSGDISVSLSGIPVEVAVQLSSPDPVATVSRSGIFGLLHVEPGEHRLVVNGPGYAPVAERFEHDGGLVRAGSRGDLTVVANEDAGWIRGDARETTGIRRIRIIEDYAGTVYDNAPAETDRFAVAVHREGRYTVKVIDRNGRLGTYRLTPQDFDEDGDVVLGTIVTGKESQIDTLIDLLITLRDLAGRLAERDDTRGGVLEQIDTALQHAESATATAERGRAERANDSLQQVITALEEALEILLTEEQDGYSDESAAALRPRILEAIGRTEDAQETELASDDED